LNAAEGLRSVVTSIAKCTVGRDAAGSFGFKKDDADIANVIRSHRSFMQRAQASRLGARAAIAAAAALGVLAILGAAAGDAVDVDRGLTDFRHGLFAEAFEDWRLAAAAGDPRGALYVGVLYDSGLGVAQDEVQAMAWYRRAAEGGSAAGAFNVGVLYDAGLGGARDPAQAAVWYARAAAAGFGRAEYNLAMLYETGTGVPRNRARAIALYSRAASHGISAARLHLVALGQVVPDVTTAPQDVALQAFRQAQDVLLSRGPAEAADAAALLRRAADQHNALAEYDLGYCYERGLGVPVDQVQAYTWYRRAVTDATDASLRAIAQSSSDALANRITHAQQNPPDRRSSR
jgi:TPR repeat protein